MEQSNVNWWDVEPPEYEFEPIDPETLEPEDAREPDFEASFTGEYLDGNLGHNLFAHASIIETDRTVELRVPPRIVVTQNLGKWILRVEGYRQWFKEHDDYGNVRFESTGQGFWNAHKYPFEETDTEGLPVILDRERSNVLVSLQEIDRYRTNISPTIKVETDYGTFTSQHDSEFFNDEATSYFHYFVEAGKKSRMWAVQYPVGWQGRRESNEDYITRLLENGETERAAYFAKHGKDRPSRPENHQPFDYRTRSEAVRDYDDGGVPYVALEDIRRVSLNATISFPSFHAGISNPTGAMK